jgi:hypothetical protein
MAQVKLIRGKEDLLEYIRSSSVFKQKDMKIASQKDLPHPKAQTISKIFKSSSFQ